MAKILEGERGQAGGFLTFKIDIPISLRLKVDADKVKAKGGAVVANYVRARLKRGEEANGVQLPRPTPKKKGEAPGAPLNRTGSLLKSIRYDKHRQAVRPVGLRDDLGSKLRGRQESLLWVLIYGGRKRRGSPLDPMGVDDAMLRAFAKSAEKEIERQVKNGSAGLVGEIKRMWKR